MRARILACVSWLALVGCASNETTGASVSGAPSDNGSQPGSQPTAVQGGDDAGAVAPSGEGTTVGGGEDAASPQTSEGSDATTDDSAASSGPPRGGDASSVVESPDAGRGCSGAAPDPLVGWASAAGLNVTTTTGGAAGPTVQVSTIADLNTNAGGTTPRVIQIRGAISGNVTVGSNKTLVGMCGAEVHGHIQMTGSVNVIVRNLTVVGYDCTDSPSDCSAGADAITVERQAHHLWFDHDDISDGSDGNLDITHACDFITVSWTKFHYSGRRTDPAGASGGHQFSNLIGHSDSNASEDSGHLTVTFHHDWWADNVVERMPRVRFGRVHLFDNLYTAAGDDYCIGVGVSANIRDENNVFIGVKNPIDSTSFSNSASIIQSSGDLLQTTTGTDTDIGGAAFTPPYAYMLDPASGVAQAVRSGAGPR